jgi:hypothetical protein
MVKSSKGGQLFSYMVAVEAYLASPLGILFLLSLFWKRTTEAVSVSVLISLNHRSCVFDCVQFFNHRSDEFVCFQFFCKVKAVLPHEYTSTCADCSTCHYNIGSVTSRSGSMIIGSSILSLHSLILNLVGWHSGVDYVHLQHCHRTVLRESQKRNMRNGISESRTAEQPRLWFL